MDAFLKLLPEKSREDYVTELFRCLHMTKHSLPTPEAVHHFFLLQVQRDYAPTRAHRLLQVAETFWAVVGVQPDFSPAHRLVKQWLKTHKAEHHTPVTYEQVCQVRESPPRFRDGTLKMNASKWKAYTTVTWAFMLRPEEARQIHSGLVEITADEITVTVPDPKVGSGPDKVVWPRKYFTGEDIQILQWWHEQNKTFEELHMSWPAKHIKYVTRNQTLTWHGLRAGRARNVYYSTPVQHRTTVTKALGRWKSAKTMRQYVGL